MFTSAAFIDKHVDDLLQAGGSCFQEAYKENSLGIAIADIQGNILDLNEHYADIVGYSSCELIGVDTVQFSYHEEIKIEIERYRQFVTRKRSYSRLKKRYITLAGEDVQTDSFVKLVHSDSDESSIFVGLFLETDRYTAPVAKSTLSDKAFHQLFEIAAMPLAVVNANKEFVLVNAKYRQIIGHAIKDAPTINHWCRLAFPNANYYHWISKEIESCITQDQHTSVQVEKNPSEHSLHCKNGAVRIMVISIALIENNYLISFHDITEQKERYKKLEHDAYHDFLTGLPTRSLLIDRLNQVISQAERHEQYFVVMYLDLDGFKHVNDTYGHKIGDQLLQVIADRLRSAMREIDTIARIGGDEFAAILSDIKELSIASLLFKRLLESVSMPVTIDTVEVSVSVSIGVVHYQQKEKTTTADQLLDKADKAMLKAKLLGKNRYCIYS